MSPRRPILAAGLGVLLLAALAGTRSWPVEAGRAAALLTGPLARAGLGLSVAGEARLGLLPLPHLSFTDASLRADEPGGAVLAEGGTLSIRLNPLTLAIGRIGLDALTLDRARITLADGAIPERLRTRLARLAGGDGPGLPRRIALHRTVVEWAPGEVVEGVDGVLARSLWSGALTVVGTGTWRGRPVDLALSAPRPDDLLAGRAGPVAARFAWPGGTLTTTGQVSRADGLRVAGTGRLEVAALPETLAWVGRDAPLLPAAGRLALDGAFEADGRALVARAVRVEVGGNSLDGAGSIDFAGRRLAVQATLAAETINFAPLLGAVVHLMGPADPGDAAAVAIAPLTGGDLDLRLSAARGRVGPLTAEDVAGSVIVKASAIEVALARASVRGGTVKGRVLLSASAADPAETEIRAQGAFDRVDLGGLLDEVGEGRWLNGPAQGHASLETSGRTAAELMARVAGRASLSIDGGTLTGVDLSDVIHRNGALAAGALARRNGRTPFERAGLSLRFSDGVGEIGDGALKGAGLRASLRGQVSLPDRSVRVRGELVPRDGPRPGAPQATAFEIAGPWDAAVVRTAPLGAGQREAPAPGPEAGPETSADARDPGR